MSHGRRTEAAGAFAGRARYATADQDLVDVRDRLDRELARAWAIQRFSRKVLAASTLDELAEITVESLVETFELESSALLAVDPVSGTLAVVAGFALGTRTRTIPLDAAWAAKRSEGSGSVSFRASRACRPSPTRRR